jgi:hypothetical protein
MAEQQKRSRLLERRTSELSSGILQLCGPGQEICGSVDVRSLKSSQKRGLSLPALALILPRLYAGRQIGALWDRIGIGDPRFPRVAGGA